MSTENCKALLVHTYPETLAKDWKRESKFKNVLEDDVRRFRHPSVGVAFVRECRAEVGTDDQAFEFKMASTYVASDFYFSVAIIPNSWNEPNVTAQVWIAYRHSFDLIPEVYSVHWEVIVEKFYPEGIKLSESMESCFEICERLTKGEITQKFLDAGFVLSTQLDEHVREAIDLQPGEGDDLPAANPGDFYFCVDDSFDISDHLQVYVTPRAFFDQEQRIESTEIWPRIKTIFPDGLEIVEEMESCFCVQETKSAKKLTQMFRDKGFIHMPTLISN